MQCCPTLHLTWIRISDRWEPCSLVFQWCLAGICNLKTKVFTDHLHILEIQSPFKTPNFGLSIWAIRKHNCFDNPGNFHWRWWRKWNISNTWRVTKNVDILKETKSSIQLPENEWIRGHFIFPNSLFPPFSNTIHLETKGRLLSFQMKLLVPLPSLDASPLLCPSAHLVTMCGSANEDFPEPVTISSNCCGFPGQYQSQRQGWGCGRTNDSVTSQHPILPCPWDSHHHPSGGIFAERCKHVL